MPDCICIKNRPLSAVTIGNRQIILISWECGYLILENCCWPIVSESVFREMVFRD